MVDGEAMIHNDQELKITRERIARFEDQLAHLRQVETNPANYHASASGFLAEIDRMQSEVREYLSLHPAEAAPTRSESHERHSDNPQSRV